MTERGEWKAGRGRRRRGLAVKLYRQWVGEEPESVDQAVAWAEETVMSKGRKRQ
jgi:hypothetical protein